MKGLKCTSLVDEVGVIRPQTTITLGDTTIGKDFCVLAGPCSVESEEQILLAAEGVKKAGAKCCAAAPTSREHPRILFKDLGKLA